MYPCLNMILIFVPVMISNWNRYLIITQNSFLSLTLMRSLALALFWTDCLYYWNEQSTLWYIFDHNSHSTTTVSYYRTYRKVHLVSMETSNLKFPIGWFQLILSYALFHWPVQQKCTLITGPILVHSVALAVSALCSHPNN